ncbi:hypothetical protein [Catenulispora rubra]|uniref:hypothetical protein n=1 Tax=Catenulispora rubra TaxID=280293 RepID=UPI001E426172|nr:hypothetical protein [Catenulispora rubra]
MTGHIPTAAAPGSSRTRDERRLADARRVADAILFEGYILYPYRSTSAKNQLRWQFGMLGPVGAVEAGVGEECGARTSLLVAPEPDTSIATDLTLRFLHPQSRTVERATGSGFAPVEALHTGDAQWVPWHEAVVREVSIPDITTDAVFPVEIAGGEETEVLYDGSRLAGRLVRTREPLTGQVRVSVRHIEAGRPLVILDIAVENLLSWNPAATGQAPRTAARDIAARASFAGAHLVARVRGGRFLSPTDPPAWAASASAACEHHRWWPVLLEAEGGPDDLALVSPIILSDRPSIAPESAGDFFDATEIDEMLALRVRTLTVDEKAQARGTDPRAAEIIDRCETMTDATLAGLHGTVRDPTDGDADANANAGTEAAPETTITTDTPWWDPAADASVAPEHDTVLVAGVTVRKGSSVRLRPLRRADAQDMFLEGQNATVTAVLHDVDGGTHVAVTLDADPGNDLHAWYGRYHYFAPDELEPLR